MSPPLSKDDLEAVAQFLEQRHAARRPTVPHSSRRGLVEEEIVPPHVRREMTEAEYRQEDRNKGFERLVLEAVGSLRSEVSATRTDMATLAKSIPPTAIAGAEAASVAGALASQRTEGKTDAVRVAADRADTNALAAKVKAHQGLIVQVITAAALAAWQLYEHFK